MAAVEKPHFRRDIEGLRAIAILLVVAYHVELPGISGGYVGVDVFFVVSGFVITALLLRELTATGTIHFLDFYARRAKRLLPAMFLTVAVTALISAVLYAPVEQDRIVNTALSATLYLSNVYFTRAALDYVAEPVHTNPLLHTWSLSVEEQFYLFWPALMLLAHRWLARNLSSTLRLQLALVGVGLLSFAGCLYLTSVEQPWAFFLSPFRAWEFAVGGWLALRVAQQPVGSERYRRWWGLMGLAGLAGTLIASMSFGRDTSFPGTAALLPAISTAMMIACGHYAPGGPLVGVLGSRVLVWLGAVSYSWYLWHWPFLVLAKAIDPTLSLPFRLALALASLVVARLSYTHLESPVRHFALRPGVAIAAAATLTCVSAGALVGWKLAAEQWSRRPEQVKFTEMRVDFAEIYRMGCDDYYRSSDVRECSFGSAERRLVLLGDSHAGHWFPAIKSAFAEDWTVTVITKSSCPAVDAPFFDRDLGREYVECREWLRKSLTRIAELKPELVLVSYANSYPFDPGQWQDGMERVVTSLSKSAGVVVFIRDVPALSFAGPECLARLAWRPAMISRSDSCELDLPSDDDDVYRRQREHAVSFENVKTVDMNALVCPARRCKVTQNGVVVYRDNSHLSTRYSEALARPFREKIQHVIEDRLDTRNQTLSGGAPSPNRLAGGRLRP